MNKANENISIISGGCYCQKIAYKVTLPVKWCANCHCDQCRHLQASPLVTWFGVDLNQFEIEKGEDGLQWFDSSANAKRAHCKDCATPLFFKGNKWPDEIHITRESCKMDIGMQPKIHVFYDRHVNYLQFEDALDKFGGSDGFSKL